MLFTTFKAHFPMHYLIKRPNPQHIFILYIHQIYMYAWLTLHCPTI